MVDEKLQELLTETVALAQREGQISKRELAQVNVDATVQEKNITHPTDSRLYPLSDRITGQSSNWVWRPKTAA